MLLATDIKDPHAVGYQRRVWKVRLRVPYLWKSKKSMESTSTCPLSLEIKEEYGKYVYVSLIFSVHHTRQTHTLGSTAFVAAVVLEGGGVVSGCPRGGGGGD